MKKEKIMDLAKKYLIYIGRWQLSTPVMTPVTMFFGTIITGAVIANIVGAVMANFVGGLIFFWIDKFIFSGDRKYLFRRYAMYLGRWQITSITLYPCLLLFGSGWYGVIAGNFVGALIFFWVDKYIFAPRIEPILWEVRDKKTCFDCGKECRCYRIVKAYDYNRVKDTEPEFRCEACSIKKTEALRREGKEV
ncbi:MAG: hypothetical protein PHT51_04700 [Patescibacteria group bacterium]|nr:hypothetical protein [Patescibacteria group bacterium]MDD4610882.1 hypothetical protein [Patescibacteria group bacterium]